MADEGLPDFDGDDDDGDRKDVHPTEEHTKKGSGDNFIVGFNDFLLKPDLMQAVIEFGFEHPSEVQRACIPQALLGSDILCQAKSGMGKTHVFVLACLQKMDTSKKSLQALVLCHTRELAVQILQEFQRLGKHVSGLTTGAVFGGQPFKTTEDSCPQILVGTPGRVLKLLSSGKLDLSNLSTFVLDECDTCLDELDMRRDIQKVFISTPRKKQVMMFSMTLSPTTRDTCKKFMHDPHEIVVDSESKLCLHGLLQHYVKLEENQKNKKLCDLLDALEFSQVIVFVKTVMRALALNKLLQDSMFPSMTLHPLPAKFANNASESDDLAANTDRLERFKAFKAFEKRILVTTGLFERGVDVEKVNIVINYDMPKDSDAYLHAVGRAGRFGTKGLAITFVADARDEHVLAKVRERFDVNIEEMPSSIDTTSYLNA